MARKPQVQGATAPVYALLGAGDVVVARLRDAQLPLQRPQVDVGSVAAQVRELPEQAQAAVSATVGAALDSYGDLAERGRRLVTRIRRQQATQDLTAQARTTARRTRSTTTTARKAAGETARTARKSATRTRKAAGETTRTARKSAASTRRAAKRAAASAEQTVAAAGAATEAAAGKVGT